MRSSSVSRTSHSKAARAPRVSPRKLPKQDRSQVTVLAIVKAAAHVLVKHGYDHATTGLIAEAAGVSIGSLYQYFPNKEAVFSELLQRELAALEQATLAAVEAVAGTGLRATVVAAIGALVATKAKNPKLHRVLKTELGRLDGVRVVRATTRRYLELTCAMLAAYHDELPLPDPARAAFLVVNAVEGVVSAALLESPATLADPRFLADLTSMVLAMLRALAEPTSRPR